MALTSIGNTVVHRGEPPRSNPYCGRGRRDGEPLTHVSGDERVEALRAFRDTGEAPDYTFWHAPAVGGARRIEQPTEIDWSGMRP